MLKLLLFSPKQVATLPIEYQQRWCLLRAIEWDKWPLFAMQPVVPFSLLFWDWGHVIVVVMMAAVFWSTLQQTVYCFTNLWLAAFGAAFVHLKWLSSVIAAWILFSRGEQAIAALALLWPIVVLVLSSFVQFLASGASIGELQTRFQLKLIELYRSFGAE